VARAIAQAELLHGGPRQAEKWEADFYELLSSLDFLPNSPTLANAGTARGQLSACYVIPLEDTMESIFEAVKSMALVQRTGGGTGFSFSKLRPKADLVRSTGGEASGPVSFMRIFDCATENIKQGGMRRGANMGVLSVHHPDILEFVDAKRGEMALRNFNLSVGVTDEFMEAVRHDDSFTLIHPRTGEAIGRRRAKEVFQLIVDAAWATGDPGLIFVDTMERANPTPRLGRLETTNPCGEIPLLPNESCNLGSINLSHMLKAQDRGPEIDWEKLRDSVHKAVRFLDDVIEVNHFPTPEMADASRGNRKIGLGVMGFAEMLIRLGVSYDSDAAVSWAERIMQFISDEALNASRRLAEERGAFPNWDRSVFRARGLKVRNATRTAIAPTGTIGIIAGTTASIEPLFALAYRRQHVLDEETLFEVNPVFLAHLHRAGRDDQALVRAIYAKGRLGNLGEVPEDLKKLFVTALEIPAERHLLVQAAFQRHVDNSVSKTINLPEEATVEDVARAYWRAWELELKGITVYRYGSKTTQVLELGAEEEASYYDHASKCDPGECRVKSLCSQPARPCPKARGHGTSHRGHAENYPNAAAGR
jgi:ribonucleoside-diphosphate reductase alpha chain